MASILLPGHSLAREALQETMSPLLHRANMAGVEDTFPGWGTLRFFIYPGGKMSGYSSLISAVINTGQKQPRGGKGLFRLTIPGLYPSLKRVGTGTGVGTVEGHCLLAHTLSLMLSQPFCR